MEELLQLITWLNTREHAGATIAEVKERVSLIRRLAPGFDVMYWHKMRSWVLIPIGALPEKFQSE